MNKTRISILGDICPSYGYKSENAAQILMQLKTALAESDYVICNLEEPFSEEGFPIEKCGENLKADPIWLEELKKIGVTATSLANNHIMDYSPSALQYTLERLNSLGILAFGAGMSAKNAAEAKFITINSIKFGLLSFAEEEFNCAVDYDAGANMFDPYSSFDIIRSAKSNCDYLIVLYHGGIEHYKFPSPLLQKKCRKMAESGANLILCQHSHCIGTTENYSGATILYGQGNAVFSYVPGNTQWNTGLILHLDFTNNTVPEITYDVIEATKNDIAIPEQAKADKIIAQMKSDSEKISDDKYIKDCWNEFCKTKTSAYLPLLFSWDRISNKLNRIFNNKLVNIFVRRNRKTATLNLLRCDAHLEVCKTILEIDHFDK